MNYEDTLSELKAIQASYSPTPFLLDPDAEPRFVINSDERTITIPEEFKFLAVKMDHLSERIYFESPRYFDGEDLATKICVVQFINANGEEAVEGIAAITDVDYESEAGKIIFRWDVDNNVTKYAGDVSFSVRFYTISDDNRFTYSWNTVPSTLPILDTIDNTGNTVTENYPTELILWQYRMQELDKTISDKISEATASLDSDIETGQSLVTAAQAARKGAEDAEGRVQAIVAGNEAYTKQQSHDLFALALKGTAEAAKSITIYPDKGSNVVATIHGFTKQEGSGDASPNNVRALTNGGLKLAKMVLDGSSDENWNLSSDGSVYFTYAAGFAVSSDTPVFGYASWLEKVSVSPAGSPPPKVGQCTMFAQSIGNLIVKTNTGATTAERLRQLLSANPLIIWYQPADELQATGLYAPLTGTGDGYIGICGKLTAKLCQGDTFITKVKSGCDCVAVFDGSEDESWGLDSTFGKRYQIFGRISPSVVSYSKVYTNQYNAIAYLPTWSTYDYSKPIVAVDKNNVYVVWNGINSLEDLKTMLQKTPLVIYYRSANYTEAADIPVSLETHVMWEYTFTGEENGTLQSQTSGVKRLFISVPAPQCKPNTGTEILCSQAKGGPTSDTKDRIQSGTNGAMYLSLSVFQGTDATSESANQYLTNQLSSGTPVVAVYPLAAPITYAHDPVDFIASPDEDGAWVITGEADGTVSAEYNKSITKAFEDVVTRLASVEKAILGG